MRKLIALMLIIVTLPVLAVCSGCSYTKSKTDPAALNIYLASEPSSLDPALTITNDGMIMLANSFEGLMTYDTDGSVIPGCAESYTVSDDGLVYTFTLRDNLKWSNGAPLDANDFVYSWTRAADIDTAADYSYLYEILANGRYDSNGYFIGLGDGAVVAGDDGKTLTVTLNAPCPYFIDLCAFSGFFPVYEPVVTANNPDGITPGGWAVDANENYVSNGAYKLQSWDHDSRVTYVANENWRNADKVSVTTLNYMLTTDQTAAYAAYTAGDLDFMHNIPADDLSIMINDKDPELHIIPQLATYYVSLNYNSKLYDKLGLDEEQAKVFRHALCLLIDRKFIVESITQSGQMPANSIIPAGASNGTFKTTDYFPVDDYEANVAEAIELLKSIGFRFDDNNKLIDNISFDFTCSGNNLLVESIQSDFASIGINMTIDQLEWNVFIESKRKGDFDLAYNAWGMDYDDPINMLELWATNSGNNDAKFGRDPGKNLDWTVYDRLIEEIRSCTDEKARNEMMHQAEDMLMDTWCLIPVYYSARPYAMKEYVDGVFCNALSTVFFYYATINAE